MWIPLPSSATTATRISYVLDASAVLRSVSPEAHHLAWRAWLQARKDAGDLLFAPHLLRYEVGHFLARSSGWGASRRSEAQERLLQAIAFADGQETHAFAPPLTFYDASYLSLAKALRATLGTYDVGLARAAERADVPVLSPA